MTKTVHNILTKIAAENSKSVDNIAKGIGRFIEASGDDVLNSFGGKFQFEKQVRNEFPTSIDGADAMSNQQVKQAIERISSKIESAATTSSGTISRFMNTGFSKVKSILIMVLLVAVFVGIGYFVFKKYRHKIPFLDKILSKLSGSKTNQEASEASSGSEAASAETGGGSRHRVRIRRRRH